MLPLHLRSFIVQKGKREKKRLIARARFIFFSLISQGFPSRSPVIFAIPDPSFFSDFRGDNFLFPISFLTPYLTV